MFSKCAGGEASEPRDSDAGACSVARWSLGLGQLLADPAGSAAFAAFLAKEFSAENIKFWWDCERYRSAGSAAMANQIWSKYLMEGAREPVNVNSEARQAAQQRLHEAPPDLFSMAQEQVFQLMKFDSYLRFLKSDIHAECARAELLGQPSPYHRQHTPTPTKLKKSLSNAEERRRGSLLPWARLRGASKERPQSKPGQEERHDTPRRPSLCTSTCLLILPGLVTTIVPVDESSVRQMVDKQLEKRGIRFSAYDVIVRGETRPVDVMSASSTLGGKEVVVERRVKFRLELPGHRLKSVKTKPDKPLSEVLRPVLEHCALSYSEVRVTRAMETLSLDTPAEDVEDARLQVHLTPLPNLKPSRPKAEEPMNQQPFLTNPAAGRQPPSIQSANRQGSNQISTNHLPISLNQQTSNQGTIVQITTNQNKRICPSLDEITNRVFEEVLQGKAELEVPPTDSSMKSDNCSSEHSSCARIGGQSVVAKLRAGVPLHTAPSVDNAQFLESMRQAQRLRLQRQPELSNCGLPRSPTKETVTPPVPAARNITKPSPAVRTSLNKSSDEQPLKNGLNIQPENDSPEKCSSSESDSPTVRAIDPPPLPPKPKVLPTKPSNWGNSMESNIVQDVSLPLNRMVYLDQPTSSFV